MGKKLFSWQKVGAQSNGAKEEESNEEERPKIPCVLEVICGGNKVARNKKAEHIGLTVTGAGVKVFGAMGNSTIKKGTVMSVVVSRHVAGQLVCTMKNSGTQLIISGVDRGQITELLQAFVNLQAQILGVRIEKKPPRERASTLAAPIRDGQPHCSSAHAHGQKRPRSPNSENAPNTGTITTSYSSTYNPHNTKRMRTNPVPSDPSFSLTHLPAELLMEIDSYRRIRYLDKKWTRYHQYLSTKVVVNGKDYAGIPQLTFQRLLLWRPRVTDIHFEAVPSFGGSTLRKMIALHKDTLNVDIYKNVQYNLIRRLQRLVLRRCVSLANAGLEDILKLCEKLVIVDIQGCPKVTGEAFSECKAKLRALTCGNPLPKKGANGCNIGDFMFSGKRFELTHLCIYASHEFKGLALYQYPLVYLDVRMCGIADEGAEIIARHLTILRELNIRENVSMSDLGVAEILWGCKELKTLDVSGMMLNFEDFELAPKLEHVKIAACKQIREFEEVPRNERRAFRLLEIMSKLVSIDVSHCGLGELPTTIRSPNFRSISGLRPTDDVTRVDKEFAELVKSWGKNIEIHCRERNVFENDKKPLELHMV